MAILMALDAIANETGHKNPYLREVGEMIQKAGNSKEGGKREKERAAHLLQAAFNRQEENEQHDPQKAAGRLMTHLGMT